MNLSKINIAHTIKKNITSNIPDYVIQQREAGKGNMLDYISGSTVIDILNNSFGYFGWSAEFPEKWIERSAPYFNRFAKEKKEVHNGQQGAWEPQGNVAWVKCRLTVNLIDENKNIHTIVKESYGSKSIIGKQSEQEHIFKAAQTDALKKAASLLGIGGQLYRQEEEQVYYEQISKPIIWTEEKQSQSKEWQVLKDICIENGWEIDIVDYYLPELTENQYFDIYTLPEVWLPTLIEHINQNIKED